MMNALALFRENPEPDVDEIKEYLAGNLCRCSGYEGQLRGILNFLEWEKGGEEMRAVSQPVRKKDAMSLVTGKPVYMDDVINHENCLIVKVLRSPHANAIVESVQKTAAEKGTGHRGNLYLGGCARGAVYNGRTELSGAQPL